MDSEVSDWIANTNLGVLFLCQIFHPISDGLLLL